MGFKENAFPIGKGKVNLTSGSRTDKLVYWCTEAGTLTVTWQDDTTSVLTLAAGDAVNMNDLSVKSVAITTGTYNVY